MLAFNGLWQHLFRNFAKADPSWKILTGKAIRIFIGTMLPG